MDWPQHEDDDFDFEEAFDVNFTIPGPPLDIFNSTPNRLRNPEIQANRFPRPPIAPIKFNLSSAWPSTAMEQRQSSPVYPRPQSLVNYQQHHQGMISNRDSPVAYHSRSTNCPKLVPIVQLQNQIFEKLFKFEFFNQIQSASFDDLYLSDRNVVLSAPTGGGKTVAMELAMLRMFGKKINDAKVIYIAPTKALCDERQRDWERRFGQLGITCKSLTGDTMVSEIAKAQSSQIIVTTPEKWDSVLRQSKDTHRLMKYVYLILIDEIHCIKDGVRGATLEAVLTRMKSLSSFPSNAHLGLPSVRIVAVSATVPNLIDFSAWLTDTNGREAVTKSFGNEYRPVKINQYVIGLSVNGSVFQFEDSLKYKLTDLIRKYANFKPTLVFCATRKSCMSAAEYLANDVSASELFLNAGNRQLLEDASQKLTDKRLAAYFKNGVGFHHGALAYSDRQTIEEFFLRGILKVICTTSTLAVGVNLPAHLVIIKGTHHYDFNAGKHVEYSDLDVLQMIGRAGRPQFDDSATAVILTTSDKKDHYENMGKQVIESCLHESLIEHLNAEIAMGNIKCEDSAMRWLKSTFLYVRIKRNPSFYRLKNCSVEDAKLSAENRLESIFLKDLELLKKSSMVCSGAAEKELIPQEFGLIMTAYYLKYKTVATFVAFKQSGSQRDILELLSKSEEFAEIRFHQDKTALNALNKDQLIRFPVKGKVSEPHQKIFLLIQASVAELNLTEFAGQTKAKAPFLTTDANIIMRNAQRLTNGMINVFLAKKVFYSSISALMVAQAIQCKMWNYSSSKLRQVEGLGQQFARSLAKVGIDTFQKLAKAPQTQIEMLCNRNPPFGKRVTDAAATFPIISMKLFQFTPISHPKNAKSIEINVSLKLENSTSSKNLKYFTFHFVAGFSSGNIIDYRKIATPKLQSGMSFTIKSSEEFSSDITCWMICPEICGLDVSQTVTCIPASTNTTGIKLNEIDSFENLDDLDWENVDFDALANDINSEEKVVMQQPESQLANGKVGCKHHCKDKTSCKHLCCKEGLSPKPHKSRKQTAPNQIPNVSKSEPASQFKKRDIKTLDDLEEDKYSISSGSLSWAEMLDFDEKGPKGAPKISNPSNANQNLNIKELKSFVYSKQSPVLGKGKMNVSVLNPISSDSRPSSKNLQPKQPANLTKPPSKKRSLEEERHILENLAKKCNKKAVKIPDKGVHKAAKQVSIDSEVDELASDGEATVDIADNRQWASDSDVDELASNEGVEEERVEAGNMMEMDSIPHSLSSDEGKDLFSQESLDLAVIDSSEERPLKTSKNPEKIDTHGQMDLDSLSSDAKVPQKLDEMSRKALEIFQDLF